MSGHTFSHPTACILNNRKKSMRRRITAILRNGPAATPRKTMGSMTTCTGMKRSWIRPDYVYVFIRHPGRVKSRIIRIPGHFVRIPVAFKTAMQPVPGKTVVSMTITHHPTVVSWTIEGNRIRCVSALKRFIQTGGHCVRIPVAFKIISAPSPGKTMVSMTITHYPMLLS